MRGSFAPDSNILTYFLQANSGPYHPQNDPDPSLAAERLAAYRLFLYGPPMVIVPSVLREAQKIPDPTTRDEHERWIHFDETPITDDCGILLAGPPREKREVPPLEEFAPRFLQGHAQANRQKPSGIAAKETILRVHLIPLLGSKRLDAITTEQVQQVKRQLRSKSAKTTNNVLTTLNMLLKKAVAWGVIERMPCTIRLLPIPRGSASFYDFAEYELLVEAARMDSTNAYLIALLGGEAGLRCGEMMALEWGDVDASKRQLCVARSDWKGHVTVPKGGR